MRSGPRMSRPDRVRRAVKKFDLSPGAIEAALDRIKAKLAEREREKSSNLLGNKEGRKQIQMLRDAARKTLGYTRSDRLPPTLRNVIAATDVPAMLEELCKWCEVVLGKKLTPKRDDGYEKLLAAEEAWVPGPGRGIGRGSPARACHRPTRRSAGRCLDRVATPRASGPVFQISN